MADFCSRCEPKYNDINLADLARSLEPGHSINFLCEGCMRRCLYRDDEGHLYIGIFKNNSIDLQPVALESLRPMPKSIWDIFSQS